MLPLHTLQYMFSRKQIDLPSAQPPHIVASKLAMKDTQDTSVPRKFGKIQTSFAMVSQWSPQVDLASNVSGDMQAF